MRSADTTATITVKIFVKKDIIAEPGIFLFETRLAEYRPVALFVPKKEPGQTPGELGGDLAEMEQPAGPCRTLDLKVVAVIAVKPLQGLDNQKVDRHPDRSAPVGVAAEHI
jgi:hypothetical protein